MLFNNSVLYFLNLVMIKFGGYVKKSIHGKGLFLIELMEVEDVKNVLINQVVIGDEKLQ